METLETALVAMGSSMSFPETPSFASRVFGEGVATSEARRRGGRLHPRLGLFAIGGLVLAACAAVAGAYYIGAQTWLSSEPRGVQFSDEFELTKLFTADQSSLVPYINFESDGTDLYAVADPYGDEPAVVRFPAGGQTSQPETVFTYGDLADPALWPQGADLGQGISPLCCEGYGLLGAANNGDVFALAATSDEFLDQPRPRSARSLIVVHADGSKESVVDLEALYREVGFGTPGETVFAGAISVAAPDRVFFSLARLASGGPAYFVWSLADPNQDGHWDDVVSTRYDLPSLQPQAGPDEDSFQPQVQLVAATPEDAAQGVFLVHARRAEAGHDLYRAQDQNDDGDIDDAGEFELIFSGEAASPDATVQFSTRPASLEDGATGEIVVSGLTSQNRVARISDDGVVTDIARAFGYINDITATIHGDIFVWAAVVDSPQTLALYQLRQLAAGKEPAASPPAAGPTSVAPALTPPTSLPAVVYSRRSYEPIREEIITAPLAGAATPLIAGEHNGAFCQSPSGQRIVYASDAEVPGEPYLYLHRLESGETVKVTERPVGFYCLSDQHILLMEEAGITSAINLLDVYYPGALFPLTLYDIESGEERPLLDEVDRWTPSPAGDRLLYVRNGNEDEDQDEGLALLEFESGENLDLDVEIDEGFQLGNLRWPLDGSAVAYTIGPPPFVQEQGDLGDATLYVSTLEGESRAVHRFDQSLNVSRIEWAPSGDWILAESVEPTACDAGTLAVEPEAKCDQANLVLIEVETGDARVVAEHSGYLAGGYWAPDRDEFVFRLSDRDPFDDAFDESFWVSAPGAQPRELQRAVQGEGRCPWCEGGFGWSPDGRYVGFVELGGIISILDVTTGELRVLVDEPEDVEVRARWWR